MLIIGVGVFEHVRKNCGKQTVSFVMAVCRSVRPFVRPSARLPARMEQLDSHWTDFHDILCFIIFKKCVKKIRFSLLSDR